MMNSLTIVRDGMRPRSRLIPATTASTAASCSALLLFHIAVTFDAFSFFLVYLLRALRQALHTIFSARAQAAAFPQAAAALFATPPPTVGAALPLKAAAFNRSRRPRLRT